MLPQIEKFLCPRLRLSPSKKYLFSGTRQTKILSMSCSGPCETRDFRFEEDKSRLIQGDKSIFNIIKLKLFGH